MYKIDSKTDKPDIVYMEKRVKELMAKGVRIGDVSEASAEYTKMYKEVAKEIKDKYDIRNVNSSDNVLGHMKGLRDPVVFEVACNDYKWSSSKDILMILKDKGYEFAGDILEYRKLKRYADVLNSLNKAKDSQGYIHPTVNLGKTNRINYSAPALMNIPKELLWYTVTPRVSQNQLYSVDIKNQEPNIFINMIGIDELKDALIDERGLYESLFEKVFRQQTVITVYVAQGEKQRVVSAKEMAESETIPPSYYNPIRATVDGVYYNNERLELYEVCNTVTNIGEKPLMPETVKVQSVDGKVFEVPVRWENVPVSKLKKKGIFKIVGHLETLDIRCAGVERKNFKRVWNAVTYGASKVGAKKIANELDGYRVYDFIHGLKEFKVYKKRILEAVKAEVEEVQTYFGTPVFANAGSDKNLKAILLDLPIQGTGADVLSMLIKNFDRVMEEKGIADKVRLYYTRHDEVIIEVYKSFEGDAESLLKEVFEHQIDGWTPFKVEVEKIESKRMKIESGEEED